jgi:hypothetical protein
MPKPYVSLPGQDCWLAAQHDDKIWLNDRSTWEIAPDQREQVERWVLFSPITVRFADTAAHPYVLANRSLGQEARATYLGMDYESGRPQSRAAAFFAQLPNVMANVGLFLALIAVTLLLAAPTLADPSVRQIGKRVSSVLLQPGTIVASQIFRTAHYSWSILFVNWLFYAFLVLCLGAVGLKRRT